MRKLGEIPERVWSGVLGTRASTLPGPQAMLLRGFAGAEARQGDVAATAQVLCTAERGKAEARVAGWRR